jgi:O-antigen/teichoic acid export membrane protein
LIAEVSTPRVRVSRRVPIDALLISGGLLGANAASYLYLVGAARLLTPASYSELGSMMALLVVGAVPAMGLQTGIALFVASGHEGLARIFGLALAGAAAVTAVALAAVPALVAFLHLGHAWPAVWMALALFPLTLLGGWYGTLQGRRRFRTLAVLVGLEGLAKALGGTVGLLSGGTPAAGLAGTAAGAGVVAVAGWVACGRPRPAPPAREPSFRVLHATQCLLGLILLSNLDVLLARHHLPAAQAGRYAVGTVITKVAYFLPQAVGVLTLPRLASAAGRTRAIAQALAAVALLDSVVVLAAIALGPRLLQLIGGATYHSDLPAWPFAVIGSCLAMVQILLYSRVAAADRTAGAAVWGAVLLEIVLVTLFLRHSALQIATAAVVSTAGLAVTGLLIERRAARAPALRSR